MAVHNAHRREQGLTMIGAGGVRQGILSLAIKDKGALYSAYMPYVKGGGIFIPTPKRYSLGDEVFLLLTLMDDKTACRSPGAWSGLPRQARAAGPPALACNLAKLRKLKSSKAKSKPYWQDHWMLISRPIRCSSNRNLHRFWIVQRFANLF